MYYCSSPNHNPILLASNCVAFCLKTIKISVTDEEQCLPDAFPTPVLLEDIEKTV